MMFTARPSLLATGLLLALVSAAAGAAEPDPLFAGHESLEARLEAPFKQIMRERPVEDEIPGTFSFIAGNGNTIEFPVQIRTRGNNRRDKSVCEFVPLRLNFKKSDVDGTLFDKQDKLKLVTHCENGSPVYRQAVVREYLAYRVLNLLSDISFQARLLRMTYVSTDDDNAEETTYAILIESKDRLGKRIGLEKQEISAVEITALDQDYTNLTSVYQYLLGNLDFSPLRGAPGENCCHNFTLFSADRQTYWSIPYDFDRTGFVEAPHHSANPRYNQRNPRQRIYRGRCINNDILPATLQKFRDRRADIEALVAAQPELDKRRRKRVAGYIDSFYKLLDKEDRLIKRFEDTCL